jgi:hypothetical protein
MRKEILVEKDNGESKTWQTFKVLCGLFIVDINSRFLLLVAIKGEFKRFAKHNAIIQL